MEMTGEQRIAAPRQRVWDALNDPEVLRQCIPGCQSLEKEGDDRMKAVAQIKIGPIGARFNGAVTLSELDPPNSYVLSGEGQGGTAGFAKGLARVKLADDGGGTLLSYDVDAQVGGRLAQLGGPLIDATAKQLAGRFFTKFGEVVGGGEALAAPAAASEGAVAAAAAPAYAAPVAARPAGFPWAWVLAVALALLAGYLVGSGGLGEYPILALAAIGALVAGLGFAAGRMGGGR